MPSFGVPPIIIKLLGGLLACLALWLLVQDRNRWKDKAADRQATINRICDEVRAAADNPKLECGQVIVQVQALGRSLREVTGALNHQNAAVAQLKAARDRDQAAAAKLIKGTQPRLERVQSTSDRLEASARAAERHAQPCELSDTLKRSWK